MDGSRSVRRLVLMLVAVVAAIGLIWNSSRRVRHGARAPTAVAAEAPAPAPAPAAAPADPPAAEPESAPAATAPAAEAEAERPELSARRQSEIARVVTDGQAGLRICYDRALLRDATLVNGNLTVRVSVAPSGRVDRVSVTGPAAFRAALRPCLDAAVSRWTFPTSAAAYETKFPLSLRAAQ
jgi:pyruvate/2-oxoglutarate dehydrogenase complex dihydrolipoamide acyltransferase (E2) component